MSAYREILLSVDSPICYRRFRVDLGGSGAAPSLGPVGRDRGTYRSRCRVASTCSHVQLEPFMRGHEAQAPVKTMRLRPLLIRGQLHESAAAGPGLVDGPAEQQLSQPATPEVRPDPYCLHLHPGGAPASHPWQDAQLQCCHDFLAQDSHDEEMSGIVVDGREGPLVLDESIGTVDAVTRSAQLVGGQQAHDRRDVRSQGPTKQHLLAVEMEAAEGHAATLASTR
jgi:hypothetical protein